jgi:oligoribonuclease
MIQLAPPQTYIFLDLETTGLLPNTAGANILEIGMLAVTAPSFKETAAWSSVVFDLHQLTDVLVGCDDYVRNMHTQNGLKADLEAVLETSKRVGTHVLPRLMKVQQDAITFYKTQGASRVYLCGSNPDFDRRWLEFHMPQLARLFHYRNLDVNSLFILKEMLVGKQKGNAKHRVLDDCRQAVRGIHDHFTFMRELFGPRPAAS